MAVIGVDIGTTGAKSTLFDDENAHVLAHAYREYNLICPQDGQFELDPEVLIRSAMETIHEVTAEKPDAAVQAICITSYGESFVLRDADGKILANSMIYMDHRGTEQVRELLAEYSPLTVFSITGCFPEPMFAIYKLRWLSENRPELLEKTRSLSFICDSLAVALGADHCCDYSLASRSGMFDYRSKEWWEPGVEFAGIDPAVLPKPVPGGSCVGTVSDQVASELGLRPDTRIILGGHDQIMAAVGSGASREGDIANGIGTVDCFIPVYDGDAIDPEKMLAFNFPIVPYLDGENMYVTYPFNMSGGANIKWFRDTIAKDLADQKDIYRILNEEAPDHPTHLLYIPYVGGGGTPDMDAATPAGVIGMRINTTRGELFRGFLEGETYEMKRNLECLEELGVRPRRILTVGGGAKSPLWMQIRADIFDTEICLPENNEAGTLASAILCYRDLGRYASIPEAQEHLIHFKATYYPHEENRDIYDTSYRRYKALLRQLQEVFSDD